MRHSSILEFAQKGSKMATNAKETYRLKPVAPRCVDAPGTVTEMPTPREMHHAHIFTEETTMP